MFCSEVDQTSFYSPDTTADDLEDPNQWPDSIWFRLPDDEAPDFGDEPDAGKRLDNHGKERWAAWQRDKAPLSEGLNYIGKPERALALRNCCTRLVVHRYEHGRVVQNLAECRDLVCPTAMRSRSRRLLHSTKAIIKQYLEKNLVVQGLMVTLTGGKTVPSHQLPQQVNALIRTYGELMRSVMVKRAVKAWVRAIELTYNPQTEEWNVHLHAIWFVDRREYFKRNSPIYISQEKLAARWQKLLRLDYRPVVDIRPLRGVKSPLGPEGEKSLCEILKYVLKPGSLVVTVHGKPILVGRNTEQLYDDGNGEGLRMMKCVPLRAVCDALKSRRLFATSRNLQGNEDLDFTDDPDADAKATSVNLGRFICTEYYGWRVRGRDSDFFLIGRSFDEPRIGGYAMGP
ncbi:protein rep [Rhodopseudomonas parapalustris]